MTRGVPMFLVLAVTTVGHVLCAADDQLVTVQAIRQQRIQQNVMCAEGEVRITYQDITLRCDSVELDVETGALKAEGNVIFDQANTRMACHRVDFNLHTKVGTFYEVDGYFPPTYYFTGEELEKLDETRYRLHRGVFTSCKLGEIAPPWSMEVRDAILELEGYGHFRGAVLRVRGVPVFYSPRFLWPLKRDRALGLMVPRYGYNSQHGLYFGNALYWPVSRSFDTTFSLDLYSKGYVGVTDELRWAPAQNAAGELTIETIRDKDTGLWQWKVVGKHSQLFDGGYSLKSDIQERSNIDFFQQWENAFDNSALRTLHSHITLSRAWGPQAFNLRLDHSQTFFTSVDSTGSTITTAVVLDRLPEAEYRLRSTRLGLSPVYFSVDATVDDFKVDRSQTLHGRYGRFDIFPSISLLTPGLPWLNITPTAGVRETYYTAQYSADQTTLVDKPLSREYFTGGLSLVGPSFSRVWNLADNDKLKHLIEPRVDYAYISNPGDESRIPLFDEKDSVLVSNEVTWTLANRLFAKSGQGSSREVASLEISQEYSFSDPLTGSGSGSETSQRGPLSLWLRTSPVPALNLDIRENFDPITRGLASTAMSGGLRWGPSSVNLTWYSSHDPTSGKTTSSQSRLNLTIGPPKAPWRLETNVSYDLFNKTLLEQRYVFHWRGSCWAANLELHDYRIAPYQRRDYRLTIDLTGLGTLLDIRGGINSTAP